MPIHGRVRIVGFVLVVLANDMALGPPIHWIIFFVVGIIGLVPLTNLLDGLKLGDLFLVHLRLLSLGNVCWETVFLG
jgi:hypothetical protein